MLSFAFYFSDPSANFWIFYSFPQLFYVPFGGMVFAFIFFFTVYVINNPTTYTPYFCHCILPRTNLPTYSLVLNYVGQDNISWLQRTEIYQMNQQRYAENKQLLNNKQHKETK